MPSSGSLLAVLAGIATAGMRVQSFDSSARQEIGLTACFWTIANSTVGKIAAILTDKIFAAIAIIAIIVIL